jgi:hypothetical protein
MLNSQTMVEQKQERYLVNDELSRNVGAVWESPPCAWCLCEQGIELGNGSHGICPQHAEKILQQYRERRARRQAA